MEDEKKLYNAFSDSLKEEYGEKVYKIPVNLPITCPNRDGNVGCDGCSFCGEKGTGFESQDPFMEVENQIQRNIEHIAKKYAANKYIAYFQNFSNTYMPLEDFKKYIAKAILPDIVEIDVSTRPDCIAEPYLDYLKEIKDKHNINITIELGLQTTNVHTLAKVNRGHSLAEFIDAVNMIKKYDFKICAHVILNLPWDDELDVIEMAKVLSALKVELGDNKYLTIEVLQHIGDDIVRAVAMGSTDGLVRGMKVINTESPIKVPVGEETLGHMFNVLGNPIDNSDPKLYEKCIKMPIHRETPKFKDQNTTTEILETGIKVIDLLCPYVKGGKVGLFGGAGVGKTVLIQELINNIEKRINNAFLQDVDNLRDKAADLCWPWDE